MAKEQKSETPAVKEERKPVYAYVELLLPEALHIAGEATKGNRVEEYARSKSYMPVGITNTEDEMRNIERARKRGAAVLSYGNLELINNAQRRKDIKEFLDGFVSSPEMQAKA